MEEQREESESFDDCGVPMEETLGLASRTETLDGEDAKVLDSGVSDEIADDGGSVSDEKRVRFDVGSVTDTVGSGDVEKIDSFTEPDTERSQMECEGDGGAIEVKPVNGESAGEEETVISAGNGVTDEKANCQVKDSGGDSGAEHNVQNEMSKQSLVDGETLSVAEDKAEQDKESANESHKDSTKMDVDSKEPNEENVGLNEQGNLGSETKDYKHSESPQVPEEPTHLSKGEPNEGNPVTVSEVSDGAEVCREENGEAMEIDYTAEEPMKMNVLDNAGNEAIVTTQEDVPIAQADGNHSNEVKEMKIDELKKDANPESLSEDAAATGEVEPLDHNGLFDPSSDITNFIDFTGVSSWSGNIQTETGSVSLKEDNKATDMVEEIATEDCNEALKSVGDQLGSGAEGVEIDTNGAHVATDCPEEASDEILGSEENQEEKDQQSLEQKTVDQQDTRREEDDTTHEAQSIDPYQMEDTVMEENPNNSDIITNGLKRKADVLSEDSLGERRKTVSLAKVSFTQKPSFKIGACIARAASQMAGSPSGLKGSNETLSVESFVSQLHCAATDPVKENTVSEIATEFFLDFRNSSASLQYTQEKPSSKRGRPSNSNAGGGTEAFEFEEMGDTYWTDRVIQNGGEEQTPLTEKENYQVVPVELKPPEVKRTRRRYRRRQSQISIPLPSESDKPVNFDENAPAELIMNFSETDTIPPEKSLSKMFRHFGPIRDSQTEVDKEKNRARVVFRKGADAEVAYKSAGRFNIFGTKTVNYELSFTITETFKVQPYVVSIGEDEAMLSVPS